MKVVRSVLIVDDSEADVLLATLALEEAGADLFPQIMRTKNGEDALELFRQHKADPSSSPEGFPPSVILLDINMPRMNGFEFLEQFELLRSEDDVESAIVLVVSSSDDARDQERADVYPFVRGFLTKPPLLKDVLAIVEQFGS